MFDLHRHDEFSFYDGSGKASELAKIAKEKGHTALGLTNHGNTFGLIKHYDACKSVGIKPVLGVEGYFLPKYKELNRGYHLILVAKNLEGFRNINRIQTAAELQKYYNPIIDFSILEKYHNGVICTTACVAGYLAKCILNEKYKHAKKYLKKMVSIFGDDFYIELQPYKVSYPGMQEIVNKKSWEFAKELNIKCILTSDSHRGKKEDIDAYLKMHELKNSDEKYLAHIRKTYYERYMPFPDEMQKRFYKMHKDDFESSRACKDFIKQIEKNMQELEDKIDGDIIDELAAMPSLPKFDKEKDSYKLLVKNVKEGLIKRGVYTKEYKKRAEEELSVINANNFEDYFLIVQDYVLWARNNGIGVGPGRGSGCNCLVNYALGITDVDPIYFDLDYKRFIREDKKKLPDIDIDFETSRRHEVQTYIVNKYKGYACQIAAYGKYKVDNLINDLVKTYSALKNDNLMIRNIKAHISRFKNDESVVNIEMLKKDSKSAEYNNMYENIIDTFCFLYDKVKYMGTHAAGVAISLSDICYYTALRYDKKTGKTFSSYDLVDLERCGIIKYDVLGLNTLSSIVEIRKCLNSTTFDYKMALNDKKTMKAFSEGKANGIFQYNENTAQNILRQINANNFDDVVAASAMNRPGPLSIGVPNVYAKSKSEWAKNKNKPVYSKIIDTTYGCILYQEQVNSIVVNYGGLNWNQADKIRKMADPTSEKCRVLLDEYYEDFVTTFSKNMKRYGMSKKDSRDLFDKFLNYTFNKGHAVGYALISLEEMYYKVHYPHLFWYTKLKQTDLDKNGDKFLSEAVLDGIVVFLPHINYSCDFSVRKFDGENVIQMGYVSIKGVGYKTAKAIEDERIKNGKYKSYGDLVARIPKRLLNNKILNALENAGAIEFNKEKYLARVEQYNKSLLWRSK